jgi:nucleoside phosphorylase
MAAQSETVVVLISSDSEWKIVKDILLRLKDIQDTVWRVVHSYGRQKRATLFSRRLGKIAAAASTQYAIDYLKPKLLVSIGTCGSLTLPYKEVTFYWPIKQ